MGERRLGGDTGTGSSEPSHDVLNIEQGSCSTPVVLPAKRIRTIYRRVAGEIEDHETSLAPEIPLGQPYGLAEEIRHLISRWESGEKSLRAVPVLNAYALAFEEPIYEVTGRVLVGFDALINVLDDIIDTSDLSVEEKVTLTSNVAFAITELFSAVPPTALRDVAARLQPYFAMLFQIPAVERRLLDSFRAETDPAERQAIATQIYRYRARAMEAFAELPALVQSKVTGEQLAPDSIQQVQRDLLTYRARSLLFKDIRDIERDAITDDPTPVLAHLQSTQNPGDTADFIAEVEAEFEYSERSETTYRDVLRELEFRPPRLEAALADNAGKIGLM
jgi:hypothetical protein